MPDRRRDLPPLELLPTFEAAARHLSFTRAGAERALTQSAVSRQVQALEAALGVRLFERKPRALQLTEAGQTLLRAVQETLGRLETTTRALRAAPVLRTVTLTTTPGFASLWLIPRLAAFVNARPGVDVRVSASNALVDIERSAVDVAVRFCPGEAARGGRRLFGGAVTPVCSPRLLDGEQRRLVEPADLRRFTILHLDDPLAAWFDWNLWFRANGLEDFKPARRLHYSHYDQMIQAAVGGQGVALGLAPLVRGLVAEGRLVAPLGRAAVPSRAWYLTRSAASAGNPDVDAFVEWLLAETRADAAAGWSSPARPEGAGEASPRRGARGGAARNALPLSRARRRRAGV